METTCDGLPVSRDKPFGSSIVVWRAGETAHQFLILHRRHAGPPEFEGDWAWTPPSGARMPGEAVRAAAVRELREETGLELACEETDLGTAEWVVFAAEAPADVEIVLDEEHDRFAWLPAAEAAAKCKPPIVGDAIRAVDERVSRS